MPKIVAHFLRKSTSLKNSFINNQITNHVAYKPVIIYRYHSAKNDGGFANFVEEGIPILNLSAGKSFDINFRYLRKMSKRDLKKVLVFLKKHNVSILHFHFGSDACIFYPLIKQNKIPCVVSFYGYDCSGFPNSFYGLGKYYLRKRLFPYVNKALAMSIDMKEDLLKIGLKESKIIVHYYGSEVRKFYYKRRYEVTKNVTFLIISGLIPQKGHLFLLEAFKEAYKINNRIKLKIIGSGKMGKEIRFFVSNNNMDYVQINESVIYASQEHFNELYNADVFVHPSITDLNGNKEGIPGSIVEAMATGLPVVSTFHAGIPYIIENMKTGLLVKEWDIEALKQKILELADDNLLRKKIGQIGQQFAIKNLDLLDKEKELELIYSSLT